MTSSNLLSYRLSHPLDNLYQPEPLRVYVHVREYLTQHSHLPELLRLWASAETSIKEANSDQQLPAHLPCHSTDLIHFGSQLQILWVAYRRVTVITMCSL